MSDLQKGLELEQWLLANHFGRYGYSKNPDKYAIDLVKVGWPAVEAKRECSPLAKRLPNGQLKFITVQIFVKKTRGPRELSGPWKANKESPGAMYVVGEMYKGEFRVVFAGLAVQVMEKCETYRQEAQDYVDGKAQKPWYLLTDRDSQKITALVPLRELQGINHGMDWIHNTYLDWRPR